MNIKNRSDLADFPDGGRATLVRRYSPALTKRQLHILLSCPYDFPSSVAGFGGGDAALRLARQLVRDGLLEEHPLHGQFRVTAAGAEVVHRWKSAGWPP